MPAAGFDVGFFAPLGTAGTPEDAAPDAGWKPAGRVMAADGPMPTPKTRDDAMKRPVFTSAALDMSVEFLDGNKFNTVAAFDTGAPCVFAVRKPDGTFRRYPSAYVEVEYLPNVGPDNMQTLRARVFGAKANSRALMEAATAPAV